MNGLETYLTRIRWDHKNRISRTYFDIYAYIWFHTEIWIKDKEQRRPYTFIMRDWAYTHQLAFFGITVVWYCIMLVWLYCCWIYRWLPIGSGIVIALSSLLWAHVRWAYWKPGEQEWPPILDI